MKEPNHPTQDRTSSKIVCCLLLSMSVVAAIVYLAALLPVLAVDDASEYVMLAKSIATGQGYRTLYAPGQPPHIHFPPGFPALLAPVWLIAPSFPANIAGFELVSMVFAILTIPVAYLVLIEAGGLERGTVATLVFVVALNPLTVYLAAQHINSEMAYGFFSLLGLLFLNRAAEERRNSGWALLFSVVAIGAAYLTRTIGVALFLAGLGCFLCKRQFRKALWLVLLFSLMIAPWAYRNVSVGSPALTSDYGSVLMQKEYGRPSAGQISAFDLMARLAENTWAHSSRLVPGLLVPTLRGDNLLRFLQRFHLGWFPAMVGLGLCILIVLGWVDRIRVRIGMIELYVLVYTAVVLLPPWQEIRNLVPLLVFCLYYLVLGVRKAGAFLGERFEQPWLMDRRLSIGLLLLLLVSSLVSDRHLFLEASQFRTGDATARESEFYEMCLWVNHNVAQEDVMMYAFPAKLYLCSERLTIVVPLEADADTTLQVLQKYGVSYLVLEPKRARNQYDHRDEGAVVSRYPDHFELAFATTGHAAFAVYRFEQDPDQSLISPK